MKYYVKVNGALVEATLEQIMDLGVKLYDAEGKEVERPAAKKVETVKETSQDPMEKLVAVVGELGKQVSGIGDLSKKLEAFEARQKTIEDGIKKGFVVGSEESQTEGSVIQMGVDNDVHKFLEKKFQFNRQGTMLKQKYPNWKPSDHICNYLSKWTLHRDRSHEPNTESVIAGMPPAATTGQYAVKLRIHE